MSALASITRTLVTELEKLRFKAPVAHVYNPLVYASAPHAQYLERFGSGHKEILFLGMNPGPFGMAQTGVPFGEIAAVRDWMKIDAPVQQPKSWHPKRPIQGFDCPRSEVSGRRLWDFFQEHFKTPEAFFDRFFVLNYCPLMFLEEGGRNRTPDKLPASERAPMIAACDKALRSMIQLLEPRLIVGVGKYAEDRVRTVLGDTEIKIGRVLHPSPASPAANRGWAEQAARQLADLGVTLP